MDRRISYKVLIVTLFSLYVSGSFADTQKSVSETGTLSAEGGAPEIYTIFVTGKTPVTNFKEADTEYKHAREPNAAITKNGTLVVVFGPHHKVGRSDRAHQDLICRRSTDGGNTWLPAVRIMDRGMDSLLPTCLVYDQEKGCLVLLVNVIYNAPERKSNPEKQKDGCDHYVLFSDDDGKSWSAPKPILSDIKAICIFGGGHGFQLTQGPNKGRLIVPGGVGAGKRGVFYSDDHGESWKAVRNLPGIGRAEATGCELSDGSLIMCRRKSGFGIEKIVSNDSGMTWKHHKDILPDVWASCNNSILRVDDNGKVGVVYVGPLGPEKGNKYLLEQQAKSLKRGVEDSYQTARSNGGAFLSIDDGKTFPVGKCITPAWKFGYNTMVQFPDGDIGVIFEGDEPSAGQKGRGGKPNGIYLVRFSLDWLKRQS